MPLEKRGRKSRRIFTLLLIFPAVFGVATIAMLLRVGFVGMPTAEDLSSLMPPAEVEIKRGGGLALSHNMTGSVGLLLEAAQAAASVPVFDEAVNATVEKERCGRYGLPYTGRVERRRIFYGSLIADDSWHAVLFTALEGYGVYHSAAFVESNRTQMKFPRKLRFPVGSNNLRLLQSGIFGPSTNVTVDYYVNEGGWPHQLGREDHQRGLIIQRWKKMGMQVNDIGMIADVDETPSRDFLRAVQVCDIEEFKQDGPKPCALPKITASAQVFEGAPDCLTKRRWAHPDFVIGACIEGIRNSTAAYTPDRAWRGTAWLNDGYNKGSDWSSVPKDAEHFPLFKPSDFRRATSYGRVVVWPASHTAFHYHNPFESVAVLRNKYLTYGHPVKDAMTMNLTTVHPDVNAMIECALGRPTSTPLKYGLEPGGLAARKARKNLGPIPIAFDVPGYAERRMAELRDMIDETFF